MLLWISLLLENQTFSYRLAAGFYLKQIDTILQIKVAHLNLHQIAGFKNEGLNLVAQNITDCDRNITVGYFGKDNIH